MAVFFVSGLTKYWTSEVFPVQILPEVNFWEKEEFMEQVTAILEQVWAWMQAHPAIVTNGIAGAVLGPFLAKLLRGGVGVGTLGGLVGGVAAGFGADTAGLNDVIASAGEEASTLMTYLQNIAEGAIGGGLVGGGAGAAMKKRD